MEKLDLAAQPRKSLGSRPARRFRRKGSVPGVLYGHGDPISLLVETRALEKALHTAAGANVILTLKIENGSDETAIIRDVQRHPVTRSLSHIDFLRIQLTEKITTSVPVEIIGVAPAIKLGAILMQTIRDVQVRALPLEIPSKISVDVTHLEKIGDSIHVADLTVAPGVEILTGKDVTVVSARPPAAEEEVKPAEVATAASAEPEVIAKGKEKEGEAPAEGAAPAPAKGAAKKEEKPAKK